MIEKLKTKIGNMIQWGRVAKSIVDSGVDQISQVESTGSKPFPVVLVYPYGISANAPTNANVLQFNIGGSAKAKAGIPTMMENRFRDLKEWEIKIGNFLRKNHIYFDDNGEILLNPTADDSTDWAIQFTQMKIAFDQLKTEFNALVTSYNSHVHSVAAVPSVGTPPPTIPTIPTTTLGVPSVADMSGAKVEKVRLP